MCGSLPFIALLFAGACSSGAAPSVAREVVVRDDATVHRIWAGEGAVGGPSRDGRVMPFPDFEKNAIMLRDLVTGEVRQVTANPPRSGTVYMPVASPDGRMIAFVSENSEKTFRNELHVVNADGSNRRALFVGSTPDDWADPADWTRDGSSLLAHIGRKDGSNQLVLFPVSGGESRLMKELGWRSPTQPTYSPDGRYIAYSTELRQDESDSQVHILDVQTGREVRVGPAATGVSFLGWNADGTSVLFTTENASLKSIWRLAVRDGRQSGEPTVVSSGLTAASPVGSTARGVMYAAHHGARTIEVADIDAGNATIQPGRELVSEARAWLSVSNAWSHDGEYLAYARIRFEAQPRTAIVIKSLRTGEQQEIVIRPPVTWVYSVRWDTLPGTLRFVGADRLQQRARYRLPLATGIPERLEGVSDSVRASKDGTHRFIIISGEDDYRLSVEDVRTGARSVVYEGPIQSIMSYSDDEHYFAAWERSADTIRQLVVVGTRGADAGIVRRFQVPTGNLIPPVWTPDGRYLLFLGSSTGQSPWDLWRLDPGNGELAKVQGFAREGLAVALQMRADGRQILLSVAPVRRHTELWLIDEKAKDAGADGR